MSAPPFTPHMHTTMNYHMLPYLLMCTHSHTLATVYFPMCAHTCCCTLLYIHTHTCYHILLCIHTCYRTLLYTHTCYCTLLYIHTQYDILRTIFSYAYTHTHLQQYFPINKHTHAIVSSYAYTHMLPYPRMHKHTVVPRTISGAVRSSPIRVTSSVPHVSRKRFITHGFSLEEERTHR